MDPFPPGSEQSHSLGLSRWGHNGTGPEAAMPSTQYRHIIERFHAWACEQPGVRAVLIVGSQARTTTPADEWSDLDLVLFVTNPEELLESGDWVNHFGSVVLTMVETTGLGVGKERRVLYSDGRDVDFSVYPAVALGLIAEHPEALRVLGRGSQVLLDKDGLLARLSSLVATVAGRPRPKPSAKEYLDCVNDFWYHVLWTAKKLRRGEVWIAKMCCDGYLKQRLLRMVEWEALAESKGQADVWHDGRFLDRWAPPEVRARLPSTFAQYDRLDVARALAETSRLFSDQAHGVAETWGFVYPQDTESDVQALARGTLRDLGP